MIHIAKSSLGRIDIIICMASICHYICVRHAVYLITVVVANYYLPDMLFVYSLTI